MHPEHLPAINAGILRLSLGTSLRSPSSLHSLGFAYTTRYRFESGTRIVARRPAGPAADSLLFSDLIIPNAVKENQPKSTAYIKKHSPRNRTNPRSGEVGTPPAGSAHFVRGLVGITGPRLCGISDSKGTTECDSPG